MDDWVFRSARESVDGNVSNPFFVLRLAMTMARYPIPLSFLGRSFYRMANALALYLPMTMVALISGIGPATETAGLPIH